MYSSGENPLRVYRDLRGLTQTALLAARAGVGRVTVAGIETGRKLAEAPGVTVDDPAG